MTFKQDLSKTFRRSLLFAVPIATTVGLTVLVYAGTVPNTFTSGEKLSSAKVNANFTSLQNQINALQAAATPSYAGNSIDVFTTVSAFTGDQLLDASKILVKTDVDAYCVVTNMCQLSAGAIQFNPTTALGIYVATDGGRAGLVGQYSFFGSPEGEYVSAVNTTGFEASPDHTYTLSSGLGEVGGAGSDMACSVSVTCGKSLVQAGSGTGSGATTTTAHATTGRAGT